ncbi:MAG TPA: nucleoside triphosphate pyrophosphohydrolase [Bacteroidales bacterium]|nr:nucleoside triphosphate pyrophosphohydrolase [Bacteroidales bacterium]HQG36621.1 nucleoside triphosphate pyrophosphohydrolase [Bacteroidales bacterium]HQG53207.1 nucleoside triphosphate pyrophosphohydrolase [Bacteroidales bacterium]HQJ20587.1 nucleoside triphosphate pyrophosphohydrolase [Bacteroidales bacterium]
MNNYDVGLEKFKKLLEIVDELREKCPWDREQTNESLRKLTIEETYELADAIIKGDNEGIKEELGDLMLHIAFYSKIGEEKGAFTLADVLESINNKLIYRHPHVFGNIDVKNSDDVKKNWEKLKMEGENGKDSVLAGVPSSLPAIIKANRIQEKVRATGFDWEKSEQVWDKVLEEIKELKEEAMKGDRDNIESELGDVFFSLINACRLYGIDPEAALEKTNRKFISRFNYLEKESQENGKSLNDMTLDEMNELWEESKKKV